MGLAPYKTEENGESCNLPASIRSYDELDLSNTYIPGQFVKKVWHNKGLIILRAL